MENKAIATLQEPSNFETLVKLAKWCNPEMEEYALKARVIQEVGYFEYACMLNDNLSTCNPRSVMMMLRWVIQNKLSVDTQAGLVYLKTRNVKQSDGSFIKVLEYEPSPEGVLSMSYSTGEIIDHQRPVIHYDGLEKPKVVSVDFSFQLHNGRWETVSYSEGHFRKWRLASHENNARGSSDGDMVKMNKANKSYTSFNGGIDPEFCTGKAIKHGLDKRGTNRIAPKRVTMPMQETAPVSDRQYEALLSGPHTKNIIQTNMPAQTFIPAPDHYMTVQNNEGKPNVLVPMPTPSSPNVDDDADYKEMVRRCILNVNGIATMGELNSLLDEGDMQEMYADSPEFKLAVDEAMSKLTPSTFSPNVTINAGFEPTPAAPTTIEAQHLEEEMADQPPATQSAIPLDFTPDPIYTCLMNCNSASDLTTLFSANKDKVLASDALKQAFKKREQEINEARIAAQSAPAPAPAPQPASSPKITANDL